MKALVLFFLILFSQASVASVYSCKTTNGAFKELTSIVIEDDSKVYINDKLSDGGCNDIDNVLYCTFFYKSKRVYELAMDKNGQYGFLDQAFRKLANVDCDMIKQ